MSRAHFQIKALPNVPRLVQCFYDLCFWLITFPKLELFTAKISGARFITYEIHSNPVNMMAWNIVEQCALCLMFVYFLAVWNTYKVRINFFIWSIKICLMLFTQYFQRLAIEFFLFFPSFIKQWIQFIEWWRLAASLFL